jgi:Mg2+-importing ATPase
MNSYLLPYLSQTDEQVLSGLQTSPEGLTASQAATRNKLHGLNTIPVRKSGPWPILLRQLTGNPLILILAVATMVSYFLGQQISAYYIFAMIIVSILLGFWNEYAAERTVQNLLRRVSLSAIVERGGEKLEVPVLYLTLGDIVFLAPGSIVPADLRLLEVGNLELDQSSLTGESKTVFKTGNALTAEAAGLGDFANIAFMSTVVTSGWGRGVVVGIGQGTEFGKIAKTASFVKPETEFQRGLSQFGNLIVSVIVILTVLIFSVNALLGHPIIDSLLFALAIAVGLTPELLPIIVTISLSHGAGKLAKKHVIAKQLISIENLGNMDILCTDKTGTLTEGKIEVAGAVNAQGTSTPELFILGIAANSAVHHHKILGNAIDVALWSHAHSVKLNLPKDFAKIVEQPFDYDRQAMFAVADMNGHRQIVAKGSPEAVLAFCDITPHEASLAHERFVALSQQGLRVIALATKAVGRQTDYDWDDVRALRFEGFISLVDLPKKSAKESLLKLENLGVAVKIITGDSEIITRHICDEVGVAITRVVLGSELEALSSSELARTVLEANVFARVTPSQKLQIIQELQKQGHTVGFLGDGINDIPSLHNADVGISVNTAVDVAKDAAPLVLLRKGLDTIAAGVIEGRRTFNNTIKYILMGTSSNFGNMFSAAGASFFLPFLPMLPIQILLTNSLYDISQITIPSDNVDEESLLKPRHWDIKFIRNYMIFFGPISSLYDFLTFGIMLFVFHASGSLFQTGWFVESLATEILVVFVIRTSRSPFYKSHPGKWLTITCLSMVGIGLYLPFSPLATSLGFVPLPPLFFLILIVLVGTYLFLVARLKDIFLKRFSL